LSFLAYQLLTKHEKDGYSATFGELIEITRQFIERSRRSVASPEDVIAYVQQRGVLRKVSNDKYTFRLNGVFEYFLANEMMETPSFLNEVIEDDSKYLSFKNELDLYSGFDRKNHEKDKEFLTKIYEKTKRTLKNLNERCQALGAPDELLSERVQTRKLLEIIGEVDVQNIEPLSYESKDELQTVFDSGGPGEENGFSDDVQLKKKFDQNASEQEILEGHLFILSRVFRNIEVEDYEENRLDDKIFTFILDSSCNLGFLLLEELSDAIKNEETDDKFRLPKAILKMMGSFMPLIVQDFLHHSMGHTSLENIIKDKIRELEEEPKKNQFKLFILYFSLLDLDLNGNKEYLTKALVTITLGAIQTSVIIKLIYYLIFKAYGNKSLTSFLKNSLRNYQLKLNPKLGVAELDRKLSQLDKIAIIRKSYERGY
jgi:hypothetical protein